MRRLPLNLIAGFLALACLWPLVGALGRFSPSADVSKGSPVTAEPRLRLRDLACFQRPATKADRSLVITALGDADVAVRQDACLAVERLAADKVFDAPTATAAMRLLIPKLRGANDAESESSSRAVESLAHYTRGVDGRLSRRIQSEATKMLDDQNPAMRRRGASLSRALLRCLPQEDCQELVRALVSACRRPIQAFNSDPSSNPYADPEMGALAKAVTALSDAGHFIDDKSLASEVADVVLKNSKRTWLCIDDGVAHLAKRVDGPLRDEIIKVVIEEVPRGICACGLMPPHPRHPGADALTVIAPILDRKALEAAARAIPTPAIASKSNSWMSPNDYQSMYGPALQALADRRHELDCEAARKSLRP